MRPLAYHYNSPHTTLSQRRNLTENHWRQFMDGGPSRTVAEVSGDIISSWKRSARYLARQTPQDKAHDRQLAQALWEESPLSRAVDREQERISQLTREGDLIAAVADPCGRLLWTCTGKYMSKRAEAVNFVDGGCWDERAVGTNAVGLGLQLRRPVTVFSSEHFQPIVHDWVCYAAPILDPHSGACLGLLDLSTTWDRHTPLGQAAVTELARTLAAALPSAPLKAELELHALGESRAVYRGVTLPLSPRQMEILCLLVLNPRGLNLESLHAALYGDASVSTSTLKAELCQLRALLDGRIGSRPYRLQLPVWADFIEIWQALRQQRVGEALGLYHGELLPRSVSPELEEWRHCIAAAMGQALESYDDPAALVERISQDTSGSELLRERLADLVAEPPARPSGGR